MKKKLIPFIISLTAAGTLLGGCNLFGGNSEGTDVATQGGSSSTQTSTTVNAGDVVEKDGVRKTVVYTNDSPGIEGETGPVVYSIDSIQLADVITTTDNASRMLDLEKNTDAVMVTIGFTCRNKWEIQANFYICQAEIETEDGMEATPKSFYGEYMDSNIQPGVTKSGSNVYIIKGKKAEDIKKLSFHVDAPADGDFLEVGEDVDIDIDIN